MHKVVDTKLSEQVILRSLLREKLCRAQQRMVVLANHHRMDIKFNVGHMVYLLLRGSYNALDLLRIV